MPHAIARYWDSLESDDYVLPSTSWQPQPWEEEWMSELELSVEHECQSILFAKSVLDGRVCNQVLSRETPQPHLYISSRTQSHGGAPLPPPKPHRRIARLRNSRNEVIGATSTPCSPSTPMSISTLDLIEACKFNEHKTYSASVLNLVSGSASPDISEEFVLPGIRRAPPPSYEQLTISHERDGSPRVVGWRRGLRHTIAVNHDDVEKAKQRQQQPSPKSIAASDSTLSVDSGQGSGSAPDEIAPSRALPSYARMASTMDHVLRTSSAIYALLATPDPGRDLVSKAAVFIQIVEGSPCATQLPKQDIDLVRHQLGEFTCGDTIPDGVTVTNFFTIVVRKMVEQVLTTFARVICKYLSDCGSRDRLAVIALEHLVHVALFGDDLSLEIIQCGAISSLLRILRASQGDTSRLVLRALAVLCGTSKGCLTLLSLGGLELVLQQLSCLNVVCSVEAAGVLTQLANPHHNYVKLHRVDVILLRLLELIDCCTTGESLLLVTAAISNVSMQGNKAIEILYQHNAIQRLVSACNRPECATLFVQEQVATIFSRLAARRYEEALVAQGAIPLLLEMLTATDTVHSDYCRRIRYKAAVCIATLASTGVGLKAIYNNQGYAILCTVLEMENSSANPLNMICSNVRAKLESKYQLESAV